MMRTDTAVNILEQIHDGQANVGEYLSLILQGLPIRIGWKTKESVHLGCNVFKAQRIGLKHPEEILGKNDFELAMREEEAVALREDDQNVLITKQPRLHAIRFVSYAKGLDASIRITKLPMYDPKRQVIGIVSIASEIRTDKDTKIVGAISSVYHDIQDSFRGFENYFILVQNETIKLTSRQAACLTYLSIGKTVKQVANLLGCSTRTIEDHINILKRKLNVYSTAELIDCFWRNPIKWF